MSDSVTDLLFEFLFCPRRYHARKVRTSVCCPTKVYTPLADGMEDHNMPFLTPNLMPIQVGRAIVAAFESGLSQDMVMPEALRVLPAMRGLPFWVKRGFQVVSQSSLSSTLELSVVLFLTCSFLQILARTHGQPSDEQDHATGGCQWIWQGVGGGRSGAP